MEIVKPRYCPDCRKFTFTDRTVNVWNKLSGNLTAGRNVNSFRN
jgi:hypothetical protein